MDKKNILQKAAKEIEKRVSAVSNLQRDIQGVKSDLLDILFVDEKKEQRRIYGETIKESLKKKIEIAKQRTPPRQKYIENMERVLQDINRKIAGEKTDNEKKNMLNLNKRSFTSEMIKEISDTMIQEAATNEKIDQDHFYKKIGERYTYAEDIASLLEYRSDHITDEQHKKTLRTLQQKFVHMKEKAIEKKKKTQKLQKMMMTVRMMTALGFIGRGTIEFFNEPQKQKITESKGIKIQDIKINIPKQHMVSWEKLQKTLNDTLIKEGITYEDIAKAVNTMMNEESKKEIIDFLYAGNILGLQEYICMKKDSKYALNKATGIVDENTMNILKGGRFGMTGKEILENDTISQDVKDAYKEFIEGTINNNNENYLIQSKICMHSFLFDTDHRLIDLQPIIVGKDLGKDQEYVPFEWFYENGEIKYYKNVDPKELNRNTPEGLYAIEGIDKLEDNDYMIDGPKEAIILDPIMLTTKGLTYNQKRIKMWDHPLFIAEGMQYVQALNTPETTDNNKSKGCINRKNFGRVKENLKTDPNGSRVYITQYTKYKNMEQNMNQICKNNQKYQKNYSQAKTRK